MFIFNAFSFWINATKKVLFWKSSDKTDTQKFLVFWPISRLYRISWIMSHLKLHEVFIQDHCDWIDMLGFAKGEWNTLVNSAWIGTKSNFLFSTSIKKSNILLVFLIQISSIVLNFRLVVDVVCVCIFFHFHFIASVLFITRHFAYILTSNSW